MNLFAGACPDEGFPALDRLPWDEDGGRAALQDARHRLSRSTLPGTLAAWLAARSAGELTRIADRSHERTTHFKWFLGARPGKYTVWLHEYKPPEVFARAEDFAASVHNHRYGFCSRVLSGALHVSEFAVGGPDEPIVVAAIRTVPRGGTMILGHEDVHRVDRVDPDTRTLIVQGPIARGYSTCYDLDSGTGRRVYDLRSRLPRVVDRLAAALDQEVSVG